ncbi:MAG: adenine phosphoribosyltransferase [Candidatus Dormibacteria bacterium]
MPRRTPVPIGSPAADLAGRLSAAVRTVADFPRPGVAFRDITPLLSDPAAFADSVDAIARAHADQRVDVVAGVESRGFIMAAPVAYLLGAGFVPIRKAGRLPSATMSVDYALEYGTAVLEVHTDAIRSGQRVLIVDDLLATGGTAAAAIQLVETLGGVVTGVAFLIELAELGGAAALGGRPHTSLVILGPEKT